MKKYNLFIILVISIVASATILRCGTPKPVGEITSFSDSVSIEKKSGSLWLIEARQGKSMNHPSFAIWAEDSTGRFLRTIFITKSYATGIFDHQMLGDTIWVKNSGPSYQPAALPVWTQRKGSDGGNSAVPTPDHPYTDAYSGATPTGSFTLATTLPLQEGPIHIYMEINQPWDWNDTWTTVKFPGNAAYAHSAQPSLVLRGRVTPRDTVVVLTPMGHGDPKGESGKVYPDVETLTTARDIFESVRLIKQ